jgi:hypothetical protein
MFLSPSGHFSFFGKIWSRSASRLHSSNGTRSRTAKNFFNIRIPDCQGISLKGNHNLKKIAKMEMTMEKAEDFRMDGVFPLFYVMLKVSLVKGENAQGIA